MKTGCFLSPFIDTVDAKVCIFNLQSISQAGRRGFEPRLPLHLFKGLRTSPLSHLTLFTSKTRIGCCFFQLQRFFERCHCLLLGF